MQLSIEGLSQAEMVELRQRLDDELSRLRKGELHLFAGEYLKKAEKAGFNLSEALAELDSFRPKGMKEPRRRTKSKVVRYRDPENALNTWCGQGMPPGWIRAYERDGRSRREFAVEASAQPS